MKKSKKIELHMHQIRDFIDDKDRFYNRFFLKQDPRQYEYRGVRKAFEVGNIIDESIKNKYLGINNKNLITGKLINKTDQVVISASMQAYTKKYNNKTEFFHGHKVVEFKVPVKNFIIICRPDLIAYNFLDNDLFIIEIKTKAQEADTQETLDFQTMCYCWASYRWNFKIPKGVLKRTIKKIRLKQKKTESQQDFFIRLLDDVTDNPDKYVTSSYREINRDMIYEFERYLLEILKDMKTAINSRNKYKFYRKSTEYWG